MTELKPFLTKIRPTLLLIEAPLVSVRGLTRDVETHSFNVSKMFLPKCQYFFTPSTFVYPLLYPLITFLV